MNSLAESDVESCGEVGGHLIVTAEDHLVASDSEFFVLVEGEQGDAAEVFGEVAFDLCGEGGAQVESASVGESSVPGKGIEGTQEADGRLGVFELFFVDVDHPLVGIADERVQPVLFFGAERKAIAEEGTGVGAEGGGGPVLAAG